MQYPAKKSLYIFLTAVLGVLMFLLLDRIVVFFYLFLAAGGYIVPPFTYLQFLVVDYFILIVVMMLGAWYGIWLGLYWYDKIYEQGTHKGFVRHLSSRYFPRPEVKQDENAIAALRTRLAEDLNQLENLPQKPLPKIPLPAIKRKIVRRRAPKKLNSL